MISTFDELTFDEPEFVDESVSFNKSAFDNPVFDKSNSFAESRSFDNTERIRLALATDSFCARRVVARYFTSEALRATAIKL
mgnify:CR=1 FL=1